MKRIAVAKSSDIRENEIFVTRAEGISILLARVKGQAQAVENKCPHMGLSMARGTIEDGALRCPFHGSRFDLCSGRNLDWVNAILSVPMPGWSHKLLAMGRKPADLRRFETSEEAGSVFVTLPS